MEKVGLSSKVVKQIFILIISLFIIITITGFIALIVFSSSKENKEINNEENKEQISYVLDLQINYPSSVPELYPNDEITNLKIYCNVDNEKEIKAVNPYAKEICIDDLDKILLKEPQDEVCTEIYGGEATAKLYGKINGKEYSEDFALTNGCEIDRWKEVVEAIIDFR